MRPRTPRAPDALLARIRWGNVAGAVAVLLAIGLVLAWPRPAAGPLGASLPAPPPPGGRGAIDERAGAGGWRTRRHRRRTRRTTPEDRPRRGTRRGRSHRHRVPVSRRRPHHPDGGSSPRRARRRRVGRQPAWDAVEAAPSARPVAAPLRVRVPAGPLPARPTDSGEFGP